MPWRAKAEIMVSRGEARTFSEACAKLRRTDRSAKLPTAIETPANRRLRLPYKDD
jgi:hypothetical protein